MQNDVNLFYIQESLYLKRLIKVSYKLMHSMWNLPSSIKSRCINPKYVEFSNYKLLFR